MCTKGTLCTLAQRVQALCCCTEEYASSPRNSKPVAPSHCVRHIAEIINQQTCFSDGGLFCVMQGWSPLHLAVYNRHSEVVALLLENEADFDDKSVQVTGRMPQTYAKSSS